MVPCLFILLLLIVSPFGAVTSASDTPTPTPTPTPTSTPSETPTPTPTPVPVPAPAPAPAPVDVPDYIWNTLKGKNGPTTNRAFFSFALSSDDNTLLVLGGNDKQNWKYQLNTSDWIKSEEKLSISGQCTTQGPDVNHVYIFGGKGTMADGQLADTAILRNYSWEWDNVSDMTPPAPEKHLLNSACVYADERFYVFGGSTTDPSVCTSDLIFYNMTTMTWENATMEAGPSARSGSSLVSYMDVNNTHWLVLFGGSCNGQAVFDNHVWWYNVSGRNWLSTPGGVALNSPSVVKKDNEIVLIFGGKNDKGEPQNGFYFYNLTAQEYMNVDVKDKPTPRFGHSVTYARRRMIVYGGETQEQESGDVLYQFVMEKDCKADNSTCGVCVLAGCGWCGAIEGSTAGETCVAGNAYGQYVPGTCKETFTVNPVSCRITPTIPKWLVPVLVVALVLIFALVVATYIVDWRQGNTRSRGYEVVS